MSFYTVSQLPSTTPMPGLTRRSVYLDNLMLTFFEFEPGAIIPEHQHPHEQITLVLEGEMAFTLDGKTQVLLPGDGVTVPPNVRHGAVMKNQFTRAVDAWHPVREDYK